MRFRKPMANERTRWTKLEEKTVSQLIRNGCTINEIQKKFPYRSSVSIKNKIRRFRYKEDKYGFKHRDEKKSTTEDWIKKIKPKSIFEGFAGVGNLTCLYINCKSVKEIFACEIKEDIFQKLKNNISDKFGVQFKKKRSSQFNEYFARILNKNIFLFREDSQKIASYLYSINKSFDYVDLDTCGSVIPSIPIYLKLIKKGDMAVTFGEFHSYRFGRKDVLIKSFPTLYQNIIDKKINNISWKKFRNFLLREVALKGIQTIRYNELKKIMMNEECLLGKENGIAGVYRVLFKVTKASSLAQILNNSQKLF